MNTVRLAAAGAGKTYRICCEALEEIRENECARVLMVTYTNRGAEAIRAELWRITGWHSYLYMVSVSLEGTDKTISDVYNWYKQTSFSRFLAGAFT